MTQSQNRYLNITETFALVRIAWPLAIAYLGEMAMSVVDILIVGRLGSTELAGVGLSATLGFEISVLAFATLSIVGVLVSQANGRENLDDIAHRLRQGLLVALFLSVPIVVLLQSLEPFLALTGQDQEVITISNEYLGFAAWSYIPGLCFLVLKEFTAALSRTRPVMMVTLLAILLNGLLTYCLVFGVSIFPTMGVGGAGLATTIVSTLMFISLFIYCHYSTAFRHLSLFTGPWSVDLSLWWRIFRLGLPVGCIGAFESGLFAFVAIMMGAIDPNALAANQIVFNFVGMSFMITMAVGDAVAIRVAFHLSKNQVLLARRSGLLALTMGAINMIIAAGIYMNFSSELAGLFIDKAAPENHAVFAYAVSFFFIAAFFQVGDGLQAVASRALRGMEDTFVPMCIAVMGYWLLGALAGYVFAFYFDFGAQGIWTGLAIGLTATAAMMVGRFLILSKRLLQ
jgi:MATE family multidrug resistance protein